jgi:hypothetical protein
MLEHYSCFILSNVSKHVTECLQADFSFTVSSKLYFNIITIINILLKASFENTKCFLCNKLLRFAALPHKSRKTSCHLKVFLIEF